MANKNPNTSGLKPFKKGETGNKNGRPKESEMDLNKLVNNAAKAMKAVYSKIDSLGPNYQHNDNRGI
jgi:hypothetical protein